MVKRHTLQINESAFAEFQSVKEQLNSKNDSDALSALMQRELIKSEVTIISQNKVSNRLEAIGDLNHEYEKQAKKVSI
jgi:hypothetical protein